jgi:hypothetical protein
MKPALLKRTIFIASWRKPAMARPDNKNAVELHGCIVCTEKFN